MIEVFKRRDGRWGWRLRADNHKIIAGDMSQGYENRGDAAEMADRVVRGGFLNADLVYVAGSET